MGPENGPTATGITSFGHPEPDRIGRIHRFLSEKGVVSSLRYDREGRVYIRFSHHFSNTVEEIERVLAWMEESGKGRGGAAAGPRIFAAPDLQ